MNNELLKKLEVYTEIVRTTMNDLIDEIQGDYTGWCELGTMLLYRLVRDNMPNASNEVIKGCFNEEGHFWNKINGYIVDTTVDQFRKIKPGVISSRCYRYYNELNIVSFDEEDLVRMTESDGVYNAIMCEINSR